MKDAEFLLYEGDSAFLLCKCEEWGIIFIMMEEEVQGYEGK